MERKDPKLENVFKSYFNEDKPSKDLLLPAQLAMKQNKSKRTFKTFFAIFTPIMAVLVLFAIIPSLLPKSSNKDVVNSSQINNSSSTPSANTYKLSNLSKKAASEEQLTNYQIIIPDFENILNPTYTIFSDSFNDLLLLYKFRNITSIGIDEVKIYYELTDNKISYDLASYTNLENYYYNGKNYNYESKYENGEYILKARLITNSRNIYLDIMSKGYNIESYFDKLK